MYLYLILIQFFYFICVEVLGSVLIFLILIIIVLHISVATLGSVVLSAASGRCRLLTDSPMENLHPLLSTSHFFALFLVFSPHFGANIHFNVIFLLSL